MRAMDKTMIIAVGNERLWAKFCKILGAEEMLTDPRFASPEAGARLHRAKFRDAGVSRPRISASRLDHGSAA